MKDSDFDLALRLGRAPALLPEVVLAQKIRMILETEVGTLPFDPNFGTRLDDFVGRIGQKSRVDAARLRVVSALSRFLPDLNVTHVEARLTNFSAVTSDHRNVPTAERVMASEAIAARLQVSITVMSETGPVEIDATFDE